MGFYDDDLYRYHCGGVINKARSSQNFQTRQRYESEKKRIIFYYGYLRYLHNVSCHYNRRYVVMQKHILPLCRTILMYSIGILAGVTALPKEKLFSF